MFGIAAVNNVIFKKHTIVVWVQAQRTTTTTKSLCRDARQKLRRKSSTERWSAAGEQTYIATTISAVWFKTKLESNERLEKKMISIIKNK